MGLKISNNGDRPRVDVYGEIGDPYDGVTAKQFSQELAQIDAKKPIDVHIYSGGGSFFDGISIYGQLHERPGEVHVTVDGLAASAASLIAMAGNTITMAKHSWMMIHEARGALQGRSADFRAAADQLDRTNKQIVAIYTPRWKGTADELVSALDTELWLTDEDTVTTGLADGISGTLAIAARIDPAKFEYRNIPKRLSNQDYVLELEKQIEVSLK